MADRMKGRIVLVTGAGSSGPGWGNGKAAVVLYAREGAKTIPWIGYSYAALFLAPDEVRDITGGQLPVDGGITLRCA